MFVLWLGFEKKMAKRRDLSADGARLIEAYGDMQSDDVL
jgi:hypothetical protein